jgi:NTP pyrophosphatase (non-canonical NTP hydrolase)
VNDDTPIRVLKDAVAAFNQARDWDRYHSPRNLAMALSVEASELLELFLWSSDNGPQPPVATRRGRVPEELADVLILTLNLAIRLDIDLGQALSEKLAQNARKYPAERVAGRLEKYDEYVESPEQTSGPSMPHTSSATADPPG